jgi:hypothetical protein
MTPPVCFHCQHCRALINGREPVCARAHEEAFDPVRGWRSVRPYPTCASERARAILFRLNRCGPDGHYFEQAQPLKPPTGGSAVSRTSR